MRRKRVNRFLGCELLESRAVMGITEGDAERNLLGRTGSLRLAHHFYGDHGAERADWFSHWTQQQGKRECNNSHEKPSITVQITCLLRRKENGNNKSQQTEKQTFLEQS